jgi:hypothetical protein
MARHPRGVDNAIARFDEVMGRLDRTAEARAASQRDVSRSLRSIGRKAAVIGIALFLLMVATVVAGLALNGIGLTGLFIVSVLTVLILIAVSVWPTEPKERKFDEKMPNTQVVQQLDSYLVRSRRALPAPAATRIDAISAQLPLLESKLGEVDPLDPLAQDARRLMGKHLPELIERYERVPAQYRHEPDGEGMTVDQRLVAGLDAAHQALGDIGSKLARQDRDAFETHGRFIESRYKDGAEFSGG